MNPQTPATGDFSKGPKLPYWMFRVLHFKWRFYVLAVVIVLLGGALYLGIKMPWKSDRAADGQNVAVRESKNFLENFGIGGSSGAGSEESGGGSGSISGGSGGGSNDGSGGNTGSGDSDEPTNNGGSGGSGSGGSSGGGSGGSGSSGSGNCAAGTPAAGGYTLPNLCGRANSSNTGPRYSCTSTVGNTTTTHNGQVIERLCINGHLRIVHNNVTVRDVLIMGTGTYSLDIGRNTPTCPTNIRVEYTEVNMSNAGDMDWAVYQRCAGGHTFDRIKVINAGRGMMTYGSITITNSYFYSYRTAPGAHRTSLSTHGGDNFTVSGNTFICVNTGCSSSVNMYSDYAPVTNYLFQDNLLAGGSICLRGGQTHTYADETHDIRVLNNRFSTYYFPECGSLQAFAQFDSGAPGNVRSGNVWHESGQPIPGG